MSLELTAVESTIEHEIKMHCNQKDIAQTYALGLHSSWPTDWARVNRMIIERWSLAGLERIKQLAHSGRCFAAKEKYNAE